MDRLSWSNKLLTKWLIFVLGFQFPLDGPKTINGIILEHLQDIPEPGTSLQLSSHKIEILQTLNRVVKSVRLDTPQRKSIDQ